LVRTDPGNLCVVGTDGRVVSRYLDPDFRTRMEINDILAALKVAKRRH
jgi:hypothetical protein